MDKPILICGPQGSGKSEKVMVLLANVEGSKNIMTYQDFNFRWKQDLKNQYKVVAVEEVVDYCALDFCATVHNKVELPLIVTTQMNPLNIPSWVLNRFQLINFY